MALPSQAPLHKGLTEEIETSGPPKSKTLMVSTYVQGVGNTASLIVTV